jgi:AraC family transcriptional regulator, positive regulator of tynA and feaB
MFGSFSTDLVPVSDRLEAWRWNAQKICGDCRFQFPKQNPFHGSIEARRVAGLELTLFSSSPVSFRKFPVVSLNSESRACIVITQLAGVRRYCQDGKVATLKRGDTTLIDSGRSWSSDCQGDCARLYMRVPYFLMEGRLGLKPIPIARRIPGNSGLGTILFGLSTSLYRQAEELTSEEGAAAVAAYFKILSACVGEWKQKPLDVKHAEVLWARIASYIEAHLSETDLGPAKIASAMGISVRHVHRVFSSKGCTIADWIRERRLRQCHSDLCDPRLTQKSITEIAFFWGFNDSAHFSRSFKQLYGICPRVYRTQSWDQAEGTNSLTRGGGFPGRPSLRYLSASGL